MQYRELEEIKADFHALVEEMKLLVDDQPERNIGLMLIMGEIDLVDENDESGEAILDGLHSLIGDQDVLMNMMPSDDVFQEVSRMAAMRAFYEMTRGEDDE